MTYKVIKRIKGRQYLYEQSTYRVGNKVKTKSRYIGPVAPHGAGGSVQAAPSGDASASDQGLLLGEDRAKYVAVIDSSAKSTEEPQKKDPPRLKSRNKLDIKIDLFQHGINEDSIIEEQNRVLKKLIEKGINVDDFTPIEIKYHNHVNTTKKGIKNKRYCVTLPRVGGQYKFRREVSKSVVRATLDNLKKQRPDAYAKVEADFKPSYQTTQKALVSYLKNSRDKKRGAKVSVLKRWGKFSPLYGSKLKPVSFGLVDNTRRPDWHTELAGIVAEIQRKGFKKAKARYFKERAKALGSYNYLIREMNSSPMKLLKLSFNHRRKRERAKARIKAINEMIKKIKALEKTNFIDLFMG